MENFFLEARQIISQIYNKNDKNYNYLLFSCFALLSNYSNYREIIEYIFLNTDILIENKSLIDIVRNHKELGLMITDID